MLGTRFVATTESAAHATYHEAIVSATEHDTVYTELFNIGWEHAPHRVLRNGTVTRWEAAGQAQPPHRPGEGEIIATRAGEPIVRYSDTIPHRETTGNLPELALYSGQSAGLIHETRSAAAVVEALLREARAALGAVDRVTLG